jgi:ornithine cyclodeaminase
MSLTSYDRNLASNALSNPPELVSFSKIEATISSLLADKDDGVEAMFASQERAFRQSTIEAKENGVSSSLPIQTAGQPPQPPLKAGSGAQVCVKTGYTKDGDMMVTKVAAGGGEDTGNTGVVFAFDQKTLRLKTVLCDEGLLTEVRTAAACAYASRFILGERRKEIEKIGIVGGGVQAVWQLRLLGAGVIPSSCRTVVVKTKSKQSAEAFFDRMKSSSYPPDRKWKFEHYEPVGSGGDGFQKCQLIHTLTPSRQPVLVLDDIALPTGSNFLHITTVGSDSPGKCELDPGIIRNADALICDSISQTKERGEFQSNEFWESLCEIGSLEESLHETRTTRTPIMSIFDSSGLPLQDVEFANLVSNTLQD